jgi:hypothetical protein
MPANDNFSAASVISGASGSITGSNAGATHQSGEPGHYNYSLFPVYPVARAIIGPFATIWYSWTCPTDGDYFFSTRDLTGANRTNFKSAIQAFTGSAVGSLTRVTLLLDQGSGEGYAASNFASVAFAATAGTVYSIQIDGLASGDTGNVYLTWGTYLPFTLGGCNSCGPDWINEICLGTITISDVTSDAIYSFGSFPLDPGNWKIRYCGGYFYQQYNPSFNNSGGTGYLSWSGIIFNLPALPTMWNPASSYTTSDFILLTELNFTYPDMPETGLFSVTDTNSVVTPGTGADWTCVCTNCDSGLMSDTTDGADGIWDWATNGGSFFAAGGECCPGYVGGPPINSACAQCGTNPGVSFILSSTGSPDFTPLFCPSLQGAWTETGGSGYVGGNWGVPAGPPSFGSNSTLYNTGALAEAALACTDTGWFTNVAGFIGTAFVTSRGWYGTQYGGGTNCDAPILNWVNQSKNPTMQLIWQPFTIGMLRPDPAGCGIGLISGTNWNFDFQILNLSDVEWDNVTVTLEASGGITSPGTPVVVTLSALATTSATISGTADPTSGLITATISIARNGVTIGTLTYPLYPIITLSLDGGIISTNCGSTPVYQQNIKLTMNAAQVQNLTFFVTGSPSCGSSIGAGQSCIIDTLTVDSGAVSVISDSFACTTAASHVDYTSLSSIATFDVAVQVPRAGISAGTHTVSVTLGWATGTGVTLSLPGATFPVIYP